MKSVTIHFFRLCIYLFVSTKSILRKNLLFLLQLGNFEKTEKVITQFLYTQKCKQMSRFVDHHNFRIVRYVIRPANFGLCNCKIAFKTLSIQVISINLLESLLNSATLRNIPFPKFHNTFLLIIKTFFYYHSYGL